MRRPPPAATAGSKVEEIWKEDLYTGGPVRPFQSEAVQTAIEQTVRVRTTAAREHAGLHEHPRVVAARQRRFGRVGLIDFGLTHLRQRVAARRGCRNVDGWDARQ